MAGVAPKSLFQLILEILELLQVAFPDLGRARLDIGDIFHSLKLNQPGEGEVDFIVVQHLERNDLMTDKAQVLNRVEDRILIVKEVTGDNYQSLTL